MNELIEKAQQAKWSREQLALLTTEEKNEALQHMAEALENERNFIVAENKKDIDEAKEANISAALIDRLTLSDQRVIGMANGLRQVAELENPIGEITEEWTRPNGLLIQKQRVPLGVIGMIYEARPNVTAEASALCLKAGNAVLLRGSSSASHSNQAIVDVLKRALEDTALPPTALQLLTDTSRETANEMLKLTDYLDVLIPRGGAGLIQHVVKEAAVPVLETGVGNCHVYIDASAKKEMAIQIAVDAKTDRPSVCNACETILLHADWADNYLVELSEELRKQGVTIRGNEKARALDGNIERVSEEDWSCEYLDLTVALNIVDSTEDAIRHIQSYGTGHSEAIVSEEPLSVENFTSRIDAAALYHNASTRFTDGEEFGFGAEIGISTQKLHVRGPMGLTALTSNKYLIKGTGQTKSK
ncbi:glutamate-5-semialdehyde dehydrogenase [Salsuginibacillus kocurii]|uniref:glutamate-5-semialdehyde dehydrogenase n=1 Tax=Salsuginibacillus kocurii TaxID=427078 RepID=UPI000365C456|nr:glutamate-5-semialdehyde dehydrogenase [Salsuginibacillus kocurii]